MLNQWYETKVKYIKQFEDGRLKNVTEPYLVDAVSFIDCEARIYEELGSMIRGDFRIDAIRKKEYADIFMYDDADTYYEVKIQYVSVDADSGKEKKVINKFLITASSTKEADIRIQESLEGMMVTYEIKSVVETKIVEVFPYIGDREKIEE
jgi:hypothetical protein